ncbi:MAG: TIGR02147 family protein [Chitinivibrionales bacterium]|nr:TIGR02147 family protein [Chitinivibrionales bacterium]MBD3358270.1 TIGR02147 family protein [Chitinivibrionales bacterium]
MPNIYHYTNHLTFLREAYEEKREKNKAFSHRAVSRKLGIRSSAGFSHLLRGIVKISDRHVPILADIFNLNPRETEYLGLLASFCQASTAGERKYSLERLTHFRNVHVDTVQPHRYQFYMEWYYSAIRALMTIYKFRGDYGALGARLEPSVSAYEARCAVKVLHKLGFIERKRNGYWRVTERDITSGDDEAVKISVRRFNTAMIELGKQAIERFEFSKREVATLTLGISPTMAEDIRSEIRAFRRKAVAMVRQEGKADRVYQLNLQFYPVTRDHLAPPNDDNEQRFL